MKTLQTLFSRYKTLVLLLAIVVIWSVFGLLDESFLSTRNFSNLFRQMAITGLLASGMVLIIISGEIDLSVGSMLGLLGGVGAVLDAVVGMPLWVTFSAVILLGVLLGLFNGYWVAYLKVPSFIVGLAGMLVFRGILSGVTKSSTIPIESETFVAFGQGYLPIMLGNIFALCVFIWLIYSTLRQRKDRARFNLEAIPLWQDALRLVCIGVFITGLMLAFNAYEGVPVPVLVLFVVLGAFSFMAKNTVFGRRIYAVGSNLEATRLSGVNTKFVKMALFGLMGLMCAFAGLTTTARLSSGTPTAGNMGELDAIASCFIGGASMRGGSGTVLGAIIGALIMASLDNGMSILEVETYWQMIVKGSILLFAVWVDVISSRQER